jgi:hypothetical protein
MVDQPFFDLPIAVDTLIFLWMDGWIDSLYEIPMFWLCMKI